MSANGGNIVVELTLDNDKYSVEVKNSGALMREFERTVKSTAGSVKRLEEQQNSLSRRFRDLVLTMGNLRFVAMDINDVFLRLPMSILRTAGELERLQQLMTGLSKETDLAKRQLEGIKDMNFVIGLAKNAPFEIKALSDSFVKLKVAGIDPTNGSMQALVDSVARFGGEGEALKRASVAIQQMAGKGVISMEELRQQLGEAVPTAMKAMADGMNVSMAELAKVVSTGTLKAGPALQKMFLRMQIDNAGAAAEMMNTWVGMTARLKTEWELAAKFIADNGFGQAAKSVVGDLTDALQSDEFKSFAAQFGAALGNFVQDFSRMAKILISLREEIGLAVQAWVAYKVVFSGILPMMAAARERTDQLSNSMRSFTSQYSRGVQDRLGLVRQEIQADRDRLRAAQSVSSDILINRRAENARLIAENNTLQQQYTRLDKALSSAQVGNRDVRLKGMSMSQKEASQTLRELDRAMDQNKRTMQANDAVLRETITSMAANRREMQAKATALGTLSSSWGATAIAARGAALATTAAGAAMNFLGGPIGVAIVAITALAAVWYRVKDAAIEAADAQKRAANNQADEKDLASLEKQSAEAAKKLADARRQLAQDRVALEGSAGAYGFTRAKNEQEREADRARLLQAISEDRRLYELREQARTKVQEDAASQRARNVATELDRELRALEDAGRQKLREIERQKTERLKGMDAEGKEGLAIAKSFNEQQNAVLKDSLNAQLAAARQRAQNAANIANTSKDKSERAAQLRIAEEAERRVVDLENRLKGVNDAIAATIVKGAPKDPNGGKGGPKESPFQKMMERLAADRASLDAEIQAIKDMGPKAADAAGAIAKLRQQIENGDFNNKGKALSTEQRSALLNAAAGNAAREAELAALQKRAEGLDKLAQYLDGRRGDIESAMELLDDPLGVNSRGRLQRRAERVFDSTPIDVLQAKAQQLGVSMERLKQIIVGDAQGADTANFFAKVAQDTQRINDSLVEDTRQSARARAEAILKESQRIMEAYIKERQLAGASAEELAKLRDIMAKSVDAQQKKIAQDAKGPFDQMLESWRDTTSQMEQASVGWANSTADAFTELVMTGKADFSKLAQSIIADLIRIGIQKAIVGAVSAATSFFGIPSFFADGGVMTSQGSVPLKQYAAGGVANSPQMAIFGEGDMPEAYVPLPDGRTIPVTLKGAGQRGRAEGGIAGDVNINITVHRDGSESSSGNGENLTAYQRMGERIKQVVREEIVSQQRPGGTLYR